MANQAAYGRVVQVKDVPSQQVTRIIVELPIESHVRATQVFYGQDVLVVRGAVPNQPYGVHQGDEEQGNELLPSESPKEDYGHCYQALYKAGFFNNPNVWAALGSDAEYQDWCRRQPSVITGSGDWVDGIGEMRCEYAHVRRAGNGSGTGIKPEYWGVPLRHAEHAMQHQNGEIAVLKHHGKSIETEQAAREWFEKKAAQMRTEWLKSRLYEWFGVDSLKDIPPSDFAAWADKHYLPIPAVFRS
ncbi:MAG: hypothetical protein Q4G42_03590 [Neisseria sp.]|nr:hypothetical protein [Neisseria sp.]